MQPIVIQGYAIHNPATGQFSGGGMGPAWRKKPKIWSNLGHLKNHLRQFISTDYRDKTFKLRGAYRGCQVFDVTTGLPLENFDIYAYLRECCEKEIREHKWHSNYTIVE